MKTRIILIYLMCFILFFATHAYYKQPHKIFTYTTNSQSINSILNKFSIEHENTLNTGYDHLYIISGDANSISLSSLPKHYIFHQTNNLSNFSDKAHRLFSHAIAVWDCSRANINRYRNHIKNYAYLPNENYEFLDPAILPCFLPTKALNSYKKILEYSNSHSSDISMHLPALFCHCVFQSPQLIIEAGVRWGNGSTVSLYEAKQTLNSLLVGLDITNCSHVYARLKNCLFLQINDLDFPHHLQQINIQKKEIDFVFIDTTHSYDHTMKEIEMYISLLSKGGALGFHDSNPVPGDPDGVKIALKEYFNLTFDESKYGNYIVTNKGYSWNIIHYPYNNGMTIVKKLSLQK